MKASGFKSFCCVEAAVRSREDDGTQRNDVITSCGGEREKNFLNFGIFEFVFSTKLISISSSLFFQILEEKSEVNQDHQTKSQLICLCDNVC
jgi:hypothetical protein